jgi:hypothetical protein
MPIQASATSVVAMATGQKFGNKPIAITDVFPDLSTTSERQILFKKLRFQVGPLPTQADTMAPFMCQAEAIDLFGNYVPLTKPFTLSETNTRYFTANIPIWLNGPLPAGGSSLFVANLRITTPINVTGAGFNIGFTVDVLADLSIPMLQPF